MGFSLVRLRQRGARLLDEVERSGTRRVQTARAWPRAAQHKSVTNKTEYPEMP